MPKQLQTQWAIEAGRVLLGSIGAILMGLGVVVFLAPANVAPMGVGGLGVIMNALVGLPIGVVILLANIPIFWLAVRYLGGGTKTIGTLIYLTFVYSLTIDLVPLLFGDLTVSDDRLLNTIFGGVTLGIAGGIIYRSGTILGGTYALALILRRWTNTAMTTTYFFTDTAVLILAGAVFGVEGALYAAIVLFLNGVAQDYVMEGPSVIRTAMIVTNAPTEVSNRIMADLRCGVTRLHADGMYTGEPRNVLYVTLPRSQTYELRAIVSEIDEGAFVVIGEGHVAYGGGFRSILTPQQKQERLSQYTQSEPIRTAPEIA